MKCARCHQDNPSHAKFCLECGTPFAPTHETGPRGQSHADLQHALTEALEQQTATAEILRVISSSPTDLQPVMDVVAESAARFCGATDSSIFHLDGGVLRLTAKHGPLWAFLHIGDSRPVTRDWVTGRAVVEQRTIHIEDLWALPETEFPETLARSRQLGPIGTRTALATPLLREGVPIGVIYMRRTEVSRS